MALAFKDWRIEEMTGYKPKTTFYMDFSIADHFGADAVKDTFNRSFKSWSHDAVFITELTMALNWKIFEHHESNKELAKLYDELWRKADEWCMNNLKDKDLEYYIQTTD